MIIPGHFFLRASGVLIHEERFGEVGIEFRPVKSSGIRTLALIITTSNPGGAARVALLLMIQDRDIALVGHVQIERLCDVPNFNIIRAVL